MAWIESHQELRNHPKTKRLARKLGISTAAAVGHLHFFWWWAMDYADNGDLSYLEPEDIADAAGWEGDPIAFLDAMINCGPGDTCGFIERNGDTLSIHDWEEYIGKLLDRKKRNKESAYRGRKKEDNKVTTGNPVNTTTQNVGNMLEECWQNVGNMLEATRPDQTRPDPTRKDIAQPAVAPPIAEEVSEPTKNHKAVKPVAYPEAFLRFWEVYPRLADQQRAFEVWKRIQAPEHERVITAARNYAAEMRRLGTEVEFIRFPKTFLNKGGWEDWVTGPPRISGAGVDGITDAEKNAIKAKYTNEEGQRDNRAILREIRALERERGIFRK